MTTEIGTEIRTYQPVDAKGQPVGLPIQYSSDEELAEALKAESLKMRFTLNRDKIKAPESAAKFTEAPTPEEIKRDADAFLVSTPAYAPNRTNMAAIFRFIDDNDLQPNLANFKLAFAALSRTGLLTDATGKFVGSTSDMSGISYTMPNGRVLYGKEAVNHMPSDEYRKRLGIEKDFAAKVDALYA